MLETEAASRLGASARALKSKEAEVEQLRSYLAEYRQRPDLEPSSTDSLRWQNTRAFLARLAEAVAFHEAELQKAVERYRLEAERWRDSHQRAKTLDKVLEKSQRDARQLLHRRDQTEADELVSRQTQPPRR
jgi:flagellar FliJ protein